MKRTLIRGALGALLGLAVTHVASAQVLVQLPDSSQTTTLTANVSEQARVTVPASVTFNVTNVSANTAGSTAAVSATNIVLAANADKLKISVQAAAASFTPPVVSATTWDAGDVTWVAGTWTAATGQAGTLTDASYQEIATCNAGVAACSTTSVAFTLAAKSTVARAGNHTLVINWKFEKI